jgi:lysine/ornithine N-monooxygenase
VLHSREYRRAEEHIGRTILVVGAGNSGADIVRHLSSLNLDLYTPEGKAINSNDKASQGFTTVYQSVTGANRGGYNSGNEPWAPYIRTVTTIDHIEGPSTSQPKGAVHLRGDDGPVLVDIDTIIFATGYNNSMPFAKATDAPWSSANVLDQVIGEDERAGGDQWEVGGVKGLHMVGLDELLLFLREDRTIAFPGLRQCSQAQGCSLQR